MPASARTASIEVVERQLELGGHVARMLGVAVGVHRVLSAAQELPAVPLDQLRLVEPQLERPRHGVDRRSFQGISLPSGPSKLAASKWLRHQWRRRNGRCGTQSATHRTTSGPSVTDDSQAAVCVKVQSRAVSADQSSPASERRARLHAGPATDTTTGAPGGASARVERSPEVGSPGASQPPAPTDPGVTVSRHRAPLTGLRTRGTTASARTGRALVR
jgi:hypothetical protein